MEASNKGYNQVVELLLDKGANPNMTNHVSDCFVQVFSIWFKHMTELWLSNVSFK